MDLAALKIFLAVPQERSFSRAAAKVHRTQPAVSQAVRRLEVELGEQLFDRSSKTGTLTEAGRMLENYGQRLVRLAGENESAVRELRDLRRGRGLIGANEAAGHTLLPVVSRLSPRYPGIAIGVRRVPALPSLDGIKRAVELKLGVALLPRRCAITEIASGRLVAVPVAGVSRKRQVMLVCRKAHRSHAADAFLGVAQEKAQRPTI